MTTPIDDERDGLPSASERPRYVNCVGSRNKVASYPPEMLCKVNEYGDEGTRIHGEIESYDGDEDADYTVKRAIELKDEIREQTILKHVEHVDELEVIKEQRLWLRNDALEQFFSGMMDHVEIHKASKTGLIIDYKTLYGDHGKAWENLQLEPYAVLLAEEYDLETVYVALVQPNLSLDKQKTICVYNKEQIAESRVNIIQEIEDTKKPDAPLAAGKWCDYCPANIECETCQTQTMDVVKSAEYYMQQIPSADMWQKIQTAKKIIKDMETQFKARALGMMIEDPKAIEGLRVKLGNRRKKYDVPAVFARMINKVGGVTFAEFCTFSLKKDAIIAYQKTRGIKTQVAAKTELEEMLKDLMTESRDKSSVEKC